MNFLDDLLKSPTITFALNIAVSLMLVPAGHFVSRYLSRRSPDRFKKRLRKRLGAVTNTLFATKRGVISAVLLPPLLMAIVGSMSVFAFMVVFVIHKPGPKALAIRWFGEDGTRYFQTGSLLIFLLIAIQLTWSFFTACSLALAPNMHLDEIEDELARAPADLISDEARREFRSQITVVKSEFPMGF